MRKSMTRMEHEERTSNIINIMNLKLIQSRTNVEKNKHHELYCKITSEAINTPSTLGNSKKFYSCELKRQRPDQIQRKISQFQSYSRPQRSQSATKILTLTEIKYQSRLMRPKPEEVKEIKRSGSRKIFVSIAKSNQSSKQKLNDPQIKEIDSRMLSRDPSSLKQKLKLCRYKDIAKGKNYPS